MSQEVLMEAIDLVSRIERIGKDFVQEFYSPADILKKVKQYREAREERMDDIRSNW